MYKVLVICQRKKGNCSFGKNMLVENTTVPIIKKYISQYLKTEDYSVDYLSKLDKDEPNDGVDFNIKIGDNDEFNDFLDIRRKYYSMIILNTCPYRFIQYGYIKDLLEDNGVVILSKVNCGDKYDSDLFKIPPTDSALTASNISSFFRYNNGFYRKILKRRGRSLSRSRSKSKSRSL